MGLRLRPRYTLAFVGTALVAMAAVALTLLIISWKAAIDMNRSSSKAMSTALFTQLEKRGWGLVSMLATSLAEPVANDDLRRIGNITSAALRLPDVTFLRVYDGAGTLLHDGTTYIDAYGQPASREFVDTVLVGGGRVVATSGEELHIARPIVIGPSVVGAVWLGLRLAPIQADTRGLTAELDAIMGRLARHHIRSALVLTASLSVLCVIFAVFLSGHLSRPVIALTAMTRRIAQRDYHVEIPWTRDDELGELATSLKSMADDLRETTVSKEYLDNIVESMLDGLIVVARDGRIDSVNTAACRATGYARDELVGKPVTMVVRPRPADGIVCPAPIPSRGEIQRIESVRTKDGRILPVLLSTSRMIDTGAGKFVVCVFRDIAELKQRETELRAAKEEAEVANRAKSEFLANMSHELRSPLNAVIGFAEIMKNEMFGPLGFPQYREYARDIEASGNHLLELINDILDLSKIEAGKLELHETTVDVRAAIQACTRIIKPRAQEAEVSLRTLAGADLPELCADEVKIKQILLNLLSNAVKFTPPGGRVTTGARLDDEGRFVLTVEDTGIGIAPADMEKAMAAFCQVDSTSNRRYQGTGLGLPLTKALVELHGGTFTLTSEVGKGTRATVTLSAQRVAAVRLPPAASACR